MSYLLRRVVLFALTNTAIVACGTHKSSGAPPGEATSTGTGTGSGTVSSAAVVNPLKYYNHFPFNNVYTLNIEMGGQTLETVLDTGSSNLLAIGDASHCSNCVNEYGYNSTYTPSPSSKPLASSWTMNFEPIGAADVTGYQDTVSFGGQTLPSFQFGVVTAEKGIPNIWGIAYQQLAMPTAEPQLPLFDALVTGANLKNQFSLRLCALKTGSSVVLGGFDAAVSGVMSQVQWTPILEKMWYSIRIERVYMTVPGNATPAWSWQPATSDTVIVDSGTNPIVLPTDMIVPLVGVLTNVASKLNVTIPASFWPTTAGPGGYATISDADIAKFPPMLLDVASADDPAKTFTLTVAPSTYFQTREDGMRFLGFEPGNPSTYILGTVFMENYVVLHDRGVLANTEAADPTARVGFYPIAGLCK